MTTLHTAAQAAIPSSQPAPAPVELTDEQIKQAGESVGVWPSGFGARDIRFARAVIAADRAARGNE